MVMRARLKPMGINVPVHHVCTGVIHRGMPETNTSCIHSHKKHTVTHTQGVFSLHIKKAMHILGVKRSTTYTHAVYFAQLSIQEGL